MPKHKRNTRQLILNMGLIGCIAWLIILLNRTEKRLQRARDFRAMNREAREHAR